MSGDLAALAAEVSPYVTAAVSAYGAAVLARAQEDAADATVGWGRRILQRIFGVAEDESDAPQEVRDLAGDPEDPDLQAALRVAIRKALAQDPGLAREVRDLLAEASRAVVSAGDHGIAAGRDVTVTASHGGVAAGTIHGPVSTGTPPPSPAPGSTPPVNPTPPGPDPA